MLRKGDFILRESNFQLIGKPKIVNLTFEANPDFSDDFEINLDVKSEISVAHIDEMCASVRLELQFFKELTPEIPFILKILAQAEFEWDEELEANEKTLEIMLSENAPAIIYSYLRPFITTITIEANFPPLVIPLMNFTRN